MENLKNIIDEIKKIAYPNIIKAIWTRVARINSALDDAYGSALGGHYGSALNCAAEAVDAYMELVALCKETTEQPLREHLRDALGSVNWEKFELPADMMAAIKKARNDAANPGLRMPANYTPVGIWCNKITKELKGDSDGDLRMKNVFGDTVSINNIPALTKSEWNEKYVNPLKDIVVVKENEIEKYFDQMK